MNIYANKKSAAMTALLAMAIMSIVVATAVVAVESDADSTHQINSIDDQGKMVDSINVEEGMVLDLSGIDKEVSKYIVTSSSAVSNYEVTVLIINASG